MKILALTLPFLLASFATGQHDRTVLNSVGAACAEELLNLWNEYGVKCYVDSALEFEVGIRGWFKADAWRGMVKHCEWATVITDYRYVHRAATLEGFIIFLEEKAWLGRSKERLEKMREISRRIRERMQ